MANLKITELTAATALAGTEVLPVVQSAATVKATAAQMRTYAQTSSAASALTATGANQGAALALTSRFNMITGGTTDTGVILPAVVIGEEYTIVNNTSTNKKVYPSSGQAIGKLSTNAAAVLLPYSGVKFTAVAAATWWVLGATSGDLAGNVSGFLTSTEADRVNVCSPSGFAHIFLDDSAGVAVQNGVFAIRGSAAGELNYVDGGNSLRGQITIHNTNDIVVRPGTSSVIAHRFVSVASGVNNLVSTAAAAGSEPALSAEGSDTDIDLILTPKGAGNVRFGAYTAAAAVQEGYIKVKAADGTVYRLLARTDT